jgi:hypothetical protein
MEWIKNIIPSSRLGERVSYSATSTAGTWEAVQSDLIEFWQKLIDSLRDIYAEPIGPAWDSLFCEMWLDGGRVIGYPGPSNRKSRVDRVSVQMTIHLVEEAYHKLPDSPQKFEQEHAKLAECFRNSLTSAASTEPVAISLREFKVWHPCEVTVLEYDDAKTAVNL